MTSVGAVTTLNKAAFGHTPKSEKPSTTGKPYGVQSIAIRDDLPISEQRELSPKEEQAVNDGLSRWWPKISPGYNSRPTELLAAPEKKGFLAAIGFGGLVSLALGAVLGFDTNGFKPVEQLITAGAGLLTGAFGFVGGYFAQRNSNENTLDMMKRLPEGATLRDMLSDPLYRAQQSPLLYYQGAGWGSTLNSVLLASALSQSKRND